jgi:hypothetical protein
LSKLISTEVVGPKTWVEAAASGWGGKKGGGRRKPKKGGKGRRK